MYTELGKGSMNISKISADIVNAIVEDLSDRRGLGQEWDQIDNDTEIGYIKRVD